MKNLKNTLGLFLLLLTAILLSCQQKNKENSDGKKDPEMKRIGMVIKIDSSRISEYLALHADANPGVRDLLVKYHLRNFSIFMTQMDDGNYYEFGYYEYTGSNFDQDMAKLAKEPRNIEWLKACDPMQVPLPGASGWTVMERAYFNQ